MAFDKDLRARLNHETFDSETMPFGQYVGDKISDLPFGYIDWFVHKTQPGSPMSRQVWDAVKTEYDRRFAQSFGSN